MAVHRSSRDIRRLPLSKNFGKKKSGTISRDPISRFLAHITLLRIYIYIYKCIVAGNWRGGWKLRVNIDYDDRYAGEFLSFELESR